MADFVQVAIVTDPNALLDSGIDAINTNLTNAGYPNWSPSDATLSVILMGVISQWAADVANVAATVSPAIFRAFGTQLCNIPYIQGGYASVSTTWTFTSPAPSGGYTIPAGTGVIIDGSAFYTQSDVTTTTGATSIAITIVASAIGSAYNGLGGVNEVVDPIDQIDWVSQVTTAGPSSGGTDQETDSDYEDRLANLLTLQAPRPITASDYASMVLSLLCVLQTGITVGRATSIDGWYPAPRALSTGGAGSTVLSCTTTNSSTTVAINTTLTTTVPQIGATVTGTDIPASTTVAASPAPTLTSFTLSNAATGGATSSLTIGAMSGYGPTSLTCTATMSSGSANVTLVTPPYAGAIPAVGASITGTAIPANTTILASPAPTATSFTMSNNASNNETAETVTITEWTTIERCVTTFVTDANGNALSGATMDALATWLEGFREINFLVFVEPPNTTPIYVTAEIHCLPGYSSASVVSQVETALLAYLNPATWGNPTGQTTGATSWLNYTQGYSTVRFNSIIGVIENVPGVQYAVNGEVFIGTTASPSGTSDITLTGPAPLVTSDITTPTIVITAV